MGGAGTNPATNYKQRFRGGFDYNVTNQTITDVAPLSNALVVGLRGVQEGLDRRCRSNTKTRNSIKQIITITS